MFYDRGSVYMATTKPLRAGMHCSPSVSRIVGNDFPRYQTISDKTLTRAPERDCCLFCRVPSSIARQGGEQSLNLMTWYTFLMTFSGEQFESPKHKHEEEETEGGIQDYEYGRKQGDCP